MVASASSLLQAMASGFGYGCGKSERLLWEVSMGGLVTELRMLLQMLLMRLLLLLPMVRPMDLHQLALESFE